MAVNKYRPHLVVLPEDDANRQIANGFVLEPSLNDRAIQIMSPSGGWLQVVSDFADNYAPKMVEFSEMRVVLLIDFDQDEERLEQVKNSIPPGLTDRVFMLGVLSEPEKLRTTLRKGVESIGKDLAINCAEGKADLWKHDLLKHNQTELDRMIKAVRPFLFSGG